jgi:hypothetical protein
MGGPIQQGRRERGIAEDAYVQEGTIVDLSVSKGKPVVAPVRYIKAMSSEY